MESAIFNFNHTVLVRDASCEAFGIADLVHLYPTFPFDILQTILKAMDAKGSLAGEASGLEELFSEHLPAQDWHALGMIRERQLNFTLSNTSESAASPCASDRHVKAPSDKSLFPCGAGAPNVGDSSSGAIEKFDEALLDMNGAT
jgi:hypothetical protein